MKNQDELAEVFLRYLKNRSTPEEVKRLLQHFQSGEDREFLEELIGEKLEVPLDGDQATNPETRAVLQRVADRLKAQRRRSRKRVRMAPVFRKPFLRVAVAASLVLLLGLSYVFRAPLLDRLYPVTHRQMSTQKGERKTVRLADGTQIWLAPASRLEYPDRFRGGTREIVLSGEAFFEVAEDREHPFIIHTDQANTTVLGTSFNIRAYQEQEDIRVVLVSGKVSFAAGETQIQLARNQQAVFNKSSGKLTREEYPDAAQMLARREGEYEYIYTPIAEIAGDLERNFPLEIRLEGGLDTCTFYGRLKKSEKPESFLKKMCFIMGADLEKKGNTYIIKGGCSTH